MFINEKLDYTYFETIYTFPELLIFILIFVVFPIMLPTILPAIYGFKIKRGSFVAWILYYIALSFSLFLHPLVFCLAVILIIYLEDDIKNFKERRRKRLDFLKKKLSSLKNRLKFIKKIWSRNKEPN